MKTILGLSCVKNEQDIIEAFVRHNLKLLDYLVVADNVSLDETYVILKRLELEFSNLLVIRDDRLEHNHSEKMTGLYKRFQKQYAADYIMFLDADEFIYQPNIVNFSHSTLLESFQSIPREGFALMPWKTFVHVPHQETRGEDYPRCMHWKRVAEQPQYYKAVLRLDGAIDERLVIEEGNHHVSRQGGKAVESATLDDTCIFHYPVRSLDQITSKTIFGCLAYTKSASYVKGIGYQWFAILDLIRAGKIDQVNLSDLSFLYAQERGPIDWNNDVEEFRPVYTYNRIYSSGAFGNPLALIAEYVFTQIPDKSPVTIKNKLGLGYIKRLAKMILKPAVLTMRRIIHSFAAGRQAR